MYFGINLYVNFWTCSAYSSRDSCVGRPPAVGTGLLPVGEYGEKGAPHHETGGQVVRNGQTNRQTDRQTNGQTDTLTHTLSHTLLHTHSHTHSHTHTLTHTHSLSHTHSLTHTHTLSHTHTLTHTHSLTHTLSRVEQLMADFKAVQGGYHSYQKKKSAAELEAQQREELMSRRFTPNVCVSVCLCVTPNLG